MKYTRGDTVVAFEKLDFLQKKHAARYASLSRIQNPTTPSHDLMELAVKPVIELIASEHSRDFTFYGGPGNSSPEKYVHSVLCADARNYLTPSNFVDRNTYFFTAPPKSILTRTIPALKLHNVPAERHNVAPEDPILFFDEFSQIPASEWTSEEIKRIGNLIISQRTHRSIEELRSAKAWSEELDLRFQKAWSKFVHQYLRWAISAGMPGPDGAETMSILGRKEALNRFKTAKDVIKSVHNM